MTLPFLLAQFLNGLSYSVLLFLLAAGLSVILGLMNVVNLAHGALFVLGTYVGLSVIGATGSFWLALLLAPLLVGILSGGLERMLRPLYRRTPLDQVLLTVGIAFIAGDAFKWIWGSDIYNIQPPANLAGAVDVLDYPIPEYRLFLIGFGLLLALALWLLLERTRIGAMVRAGVSDRQMVGALGIDVSKVFFWVFVLGGWLAGLSGVLAAPLMGAYPTLDFTVMLLALVIVVIGGMGTFRGCFFGSILIGQAETFGKVFLPSVVMILIFAIMVLILIVRPQGLFGSSGRI